MKIIVESGATKSRWAICDNDFNVVDIHTYGGINPTSNPESLEILGAIDLLENEGLERIVFYSAGVGAELPREQLYNALKKQSSCPHIDIFSDMEGACRVADEEDECIVSILGTGVNSCLSKSMKVSEATVSLGYLFSEAGSGFSIGQKVIIDFFHKKMQKKDVNTFKKQYPNYKNLITKIYKSGNQNFEIAQYSKFLTYSTLEYREEILQEIFQEFLDTRILILNSAKELTLHFSGSIAKIFKNELETVCVHNGYKVGSINSEPIQDIISYHKKHG